MVFVQSFHLPALFSKDQLHCSPWKGKARECAPSHHRRRHPWGVSSRERPRRFNEEVTLACRGGLSSMKKGRPSNCQEVRQSLFFIAIELFLALRQSKRSWQLDFWARKCLKVWFESLLISACMIIDTSTIDSRESQFRSSHRYARQSGAFVGQFKSQLFLEYKTRWRVGQVWAPAEGLTTYPPKDKLQLLCWWTVQWALVWTFPPLR